MTKLTGSDVRLYVAGYDLSGAQTEGVFNFNEPAGDVTALDATAERVQSLKMFESELSHSGFFDNDTTGVSPHDHLKAAVGSEHLYIITLGLSDEKPSIHGAGQLATGYKRPVKVGDFVKAEGEYVGDEKPSIYATLMMSKTTISSFTHTDGTVDDSAASSDGCSAVLQVFSVTGGTSIVVKLDHSTDNFVGSDDTLLTFTAATGRTAEEKTSSGTVRRYRRLVITQTGGVTSAVLALSFQRHSARPA